jgi:hypothetical protein
MPGQGVGHLSGQNSCNLILVPDDIQKSGPDKNIVAMDRTNIDNFGSIEKMYLPGLPIRVGCLNQMIEN